MGTQISELGPYVLPVWSMAPLPLCNEYQFSQLGPHWIWQFNCYSLNLGLQFGNWAIPIGAIGQFNFNLIQINSSNSMTAIQLVGLAKEAEIDAEAAVRPASDDCLRQ
jgi:hypothetical protein